MTRRALATCWNCLCSRQHLARTRQGVRRRADCLGEVVGGQQGERPMGDGGGKAGDKRVLHWSWSEGVGVLGHRIRHRFRGREVLSRIALYFAFHLARWWRAGNSPRAGPAPAGGLGGSEERRAALAVEPPMPSRSRPQRWLRRNARWAGSSLHLVARAHRHLPFGPRPLALSPCLGRSPASIGVRGRPGRSCSGLHAT